MKMGETIIEIPLDKTKPTEENLVCIVSDDESEEAQVTVRKLSDRLKQQGLKPVNYLLDGKGGQPVMQQKVEFITVAKWVVILCSDLFICDSVFLFQENMSIFTAITKGLMNILYIIPSGMAKSVAKTFPYVRMVENDYEWIFQVQKKLVEDPIKLEQSTFISLSSDLNISHISPVSLKSLAHVTKHFVSFICCKCGRSRQQAPCIVWMVKESGEKKMLTHRWGDNAPILTSQDDSISFSNIGTGEDSIKLLPNSDQIRFKNVEQIELGNKPSIIITLIQGLLLVLMSGFMFTLVASNHISTGPLFDKDYNSTSDMLPEATIADLSMEALIFIYFIVCSVFKLSKRSVLLSVYQFVVNMVNLVLYSLVSTGRIVIPDIEDHIIGGNMAMISRITSLAFFVNLCESEPLRRQVFFKIVFFLLSFPFFLSHVSKTPSILKERNVAVDSAVVLQICMGAAYVPAIATFVEFQHFAFRMLVRNNCVKDTICLSKFFKIFIIANLLFLCFLPLTVYTY